MTSKKTKKTSTKKAVKVSKNPDPSRQNASALLSELIGVCEDNAKASGEPNAIRWKKIADRCKSFLEVASGMEK